MKDSKTYKKLNYSLELLRFILSFFVVIQHCYKNILDKGRFHVPAFMITSFYFYYNTLKIKSINKIKQRFQRILIPYIIWPIFEFIINNILFKFYKFSQFDKILSLKDLLFQIIFGSNYHIIFYFQFNLILFTKLFTIISFIFKKSFIFIFQIILIVSYIFQYTNWNFNAFKGYSDIFKYSLGHISELLPFAVGGLTLNYLNIIINLKKFKGFAIFFITVIIVLILKFEIFVRIKGFWFPGIFFNIGGLCIFILFSLISFENRKLLFLLKIITKYTGGIYYIHLICFSFLRRKINFLKNKTFHGAIVTYIISYITGKNNLQ